MKQKATRTRRSPRNQERLWRQLGREPATPADGASGDLLKSACQTIPVALAKRAMAELEAMHGCLYAMCDGGCPADEIVRALAVAIAEAEGRT